MKVTIKRLLPEFLVQRISRTLAARDWAQRDFMDYAPQFVKKKILLKYAVPDAIWIETGTYLSHPGR
jgi:hypothetical protein